MPETGQKLKVKGSGLFDMVVEISSHAPIQAMAWVLLTDSSQTDIKNHEEKHYKLCKVYIFTIKEISSKLRLWRTIVAEKISTKKNPSTSYQDVRIEGISRTGQILIFPHSRS